jgi:tripartite-type tricarboxylate transporter receptor subunit TctC
MTFELQTYLHKAGVAAVASLVLATTAVAQDPVKPADGFPNRPMSLIVPFGAGGGSDAVARAWGDAMSTVIDQQFQVVNKPGGGGLAAVPDFMGARPDGYTVMQQLDFTMGDYLAGKLRENPATDWSPLCAVQITFSQIYVQADDERFQGWESFVAYSQANAGTLNMANVGNLGTQERLMMLFLKGDTGLDINEVAFDNPSERYAALIGGQVDALFEQPGDVLPFLQAGQIKPILTILNERPNAFADVPTHREVGAEFEPMLRWRGFWVLPDVPEERREYLSAACGTAYKSDEFQAFNKKNYMDVIDSYRDADGFRALIESEIEAYKAAFAKAGL